MRCRTTVFVVVECDGSMRARIALHYRTSVVLYDHGCLSNAQRPPSTTATVAYDFSYIVAFSARNVHMHLYVCMHVHPYVHVCTCAVDLA